MTKPQKSFVVVSKCRRINKNLTIMTEPCSFEQARKELIKIEERDKSALIQGHFTILNVGHPMLQ